MATRSRHEPRNSNRPPRARTLRSLRRGETARRRPPQLAEKAFSPDLQELFQEHAAQTNAQIERLEAIFRHLQLPAKGHPCKAMAGLIAEAQDLLKEEPNADPNVLDAALITAAQKVEHYEIAGYGSARTFARTLRATEVQRLLQQTLDEEELTDQKLSALAEAAVNLDAAESDAEVIREAARA